MTEYDILDAIGDIDPAYLEEATNKSAMKKRKWIGIGSLAACLLVFLMIPLGYQHYWLTYENLDYTADDCVECNVYYLKDHVLYYETVGVRGGDLELFEIWKSKNNITEAAVLQNIVFAPAQEGVGSAGYADTVFVTIPASLAAYFEREDGAWRLESLKKTIASYRKITIDTIELIYV